jgi:hypothetical protein
MTPEPCLRLAEDDALAADALRTSLDVDGRSGEIGVIPSEPEQFAAGHAGQYRQPDKRTVGRRVRRLDDGSSLSRGHGRDVTARWARRFDSIGGVPHEQLPADGLPERGVQDLVRHDRPREA